MTLQSLPKLPAGATVVGAEQANDDQVFSPRARRILRNLAITLALSFLIFWLKRTSNEIEAARLRQPVVEPVPFDIILQNFKTINIFGQSRKDVENLLGPPSELGASGPDFDPRDDYPSTDMTPQDRFWAVWRDPNDHERWVAVLFAGYYPGPINTVYNRRASKSLQRSKQESP